MSTFAPYGERSWLFEARDNTQDHDWRSLYRETADSRLSLGLANRKRIWNLIDALIPLLQLHTGSGQSSLPKIHRWEEAAGELRPVDLRPIQLPPIDLPPTTNEEDFIDEVITYSFEHFDEFCRLLDDHSFGTGCRAMQSVAVSLPTLLLPFEVLLHQPGRHKIPLGDSSLGK